MRGGGRLTIETLDVDLPEGYAYRHLGIDIPAGPYVMLVVSDTGHGMTPEVKARLFEPFFTTKPTTQNTGLGLATVYGIVVQSGGYIWVDSEPGEGTAFKICFPRVEAEDDQAAARLQPGAAPRGSETILLVEDENTVRTVASPGPAEPGLRGLAASNGRRGAGAGRAAGRGHRPGPHRRGHARHGRAGAGRAPGGPTGPGSGWCTCRAMPRATSCSPRSSSPTGRFCRSRSPPRV